MPHGLALVAVKSRGGGWEVEGREILPARVIGWVSYRAESNTEQRGLLPLFHFIVSIKKI
jgi:hypothetical protein